MPSLKIKRLNLTCLISIDGKGVPFSTLPLFQDDFYIFNNDGLKFYKWEFQNIDYLLLIYTKKSVRLSMF